MSDTQNILVMQSRTGSSRLPGKALLPIHGVPMIVVAAKRAASKGRPFILATSQDPSDDALAQIALAHDIRCVRGPLDDVLARFILATRDAADDAIVTRLTGDNPIPDGAFIDEIEADFLARGLDYISSNDAGSGLPYGLSIEMTRLAHLRHADQTVTTAYDREHVTPAVVRRFGHSSFNRYAELGQTACRATVDCLDDYLSILKVFPDDISPLEVPWIDLVHRIDHGLYQPTGRPVPELVLGTAQLGMPYGIANKTSLSDAERKAIIKTAIGNGVTCLDTAQAYGNSEEVIAATLATGWAGRARVLTKLLPLADIPDDAPAMVAAQAAEISVLASCVALKQNRIDTLMLHRAAHLTAWDGAVWSRLTEMVEAGRIGQLGVSVGSPTELAQALDQPQVAHVQLPFNIMDHRWQDMLPRIRQARATRGLTVHVRSALLQGLLTSSDAALWARANVSDAASVHRWLAEATRAQGRRDVVDLALAYVRGQDWIDGVVTGIDSEAQLHDTLSLFRRPPLDAKVIAALDASRPTLSHDTLDPARWKTEPST
ncbi:aldo/keto reductase [uncultured Sulfitobacter sp.]|uniref:aldo/keto reductase n=1 Tax=uncultured Sulfitobacter sp. TaxID=191468 RepID=UPI0026187B98|nr:aldo/keto reductase [uncultured Sulfitobacter sp.]